MSMDVHSPGNIRNRPSGFFAQVTGAHSIRRACAAGCVTVTPTNPMLIQIHQYCRKSAPNQNSSVPSQ